LALAREDTEHSLSIEELGVMFEADAIRLGESLLGEAPIDFNSLSLASKGLGITEQIFD
jgi:hypothetical protein